MSNYNFGILIFIASTNGMPKMHFVGKSFPNLVLFTPKFIFDDDVKG